MFFLRKKKAPPPPKTPTTEQILSNIVKYTEGNSKALNKYEFTNLIGALNKVHSSVATDYYKNANGKWDFRAPASITVQNAVGELEITCKVDFGPKFSVAVPAMPSWAMAGNLLAGGIIGAAYDTYSGAGLKYPEVINISGQSCK